MLGAKTPIRLAQLAIAASCAVAICYPLDQLPVPGIEHFNLAQLSLGLSLFAVLFVGGLTISILIQQRLMNGLAAGKWTEEERDQAYRFVKLPVFAYAMAAFLIFYLGTMVYHFVTANHHASLLVLTIWPTLTLGRLVTILAPHKPIADQSRLADAAPLHSTHWGHPSA